jgi:predicted O-methyltransferase YrrM
MSEGQELWTAVDAYFERLLIGRDLVLEEALRTSEHAGLPAIQVSPPQGKLLHILARAIHATRILEIGTLGGYSTIWLGRALPPEGRLITLEVDPRHAEVARRNLERAALQWVVDVRVGRALDLLPQLESEGAGPFDLTFIDADKPSTADYFEWALKLSRPGALVIVDNVVRHGEVIDAASGDPNVQGMRRFNDAMVRQETAASTVIQTVGVKGHDGLAISVVS